MGLKIETWSIAYRRREKGLFDKNSPFIVINNGYKGWYADPFLFDYDGDTYLFAEYFSYKLNRGVIVYSKFDEEKNKFEPYQEIIVEDFHLSYPVVFEYDNRIIMMPESSEADSLYFYEAVSFPDEWKRLQTAVSDVKLVDSTPYISGNKLYALSLKLNENDHCKGDLLLLKYDGKRFTFSNQGILSQDMRVARPGGNFINYNSKLYRVSQDCDGSYGKAINLIELSDNFIENYDETLIEKIKPNDIKLKNKITASGIHTFNVSKKFEVIDLKYYRNSFYRIFIKLFQR